MVFGVSYLNEIAVKRNGIGNLLHRFSGMKTLSMGAPECKLIPDFFVLKKVGFSCIGGIL